MKVVAFFCGKYANSMEILTETNGYKERLITTHPFKTRLWKKQVIDTFVDGYMLSVLASFTMIPDNVHYNS